MVDVERGAERHGPTETRASYVEPEEPAWDRPAQSTTRVVLDALAREATLDPATLRHALAALLRDGARGDTLDLLSVDLVIADLDDALERQLEAILVAPELMRLEGAWRGVLYAVEAIPADSNVMVELWNARRDELLDDIEDASTITTSKTFARLYSAEYGQFGGCPYAAYLLDFEIGNSPQDASLVRAFASIAAMAHAPTLAAASPTLLGARSFEEVAEAQDLRVVDDDPRLLRWRTIRAAPDSRYIGLLLPRTLARVGVATADTPAWLAHVASDRRLWASPIYVASTLLTRSFARFGWCAHITGLGEDGRPGDGVAPPMTSHAPDALRAQPHATPAIEAVVGARLSAQLGDLGFIVLRHRSETGDLALFEAPSIRRATSDTADGASPVDSYLGAQLPFLFIVCRLAHYLKVIQRESLGTEIDAGELERSLQAWLAQFIVDIEDVSPEIRGQRPLREAILTVRSRAEQRGWFVIDLRVRPHVRYLGASFTLAIQGRLDRR